MAMVKGKIRTRRDVVPEVMVTGKLPFDRQKDGWVHRKEPSKKLSTLPLKNFLASSARRRKDRKS